MNLLLDTHTFLWFINDDAALTPRAKSLIEEVQNDIYLSVASVWEVAIKVNLGKLTMPTPFVKFIVEQLQQNSISLLNIKTAHAGGVATLPLHHRDPFDRLLIAQSLHESFPIVGKDEQFDAYGVTRYW
jgi:PIN domain nuclease of toxin-antitoxin system